MNKLIITSSETGITYENNYIKNNNKTSNMKSMFEGIFLKAFREGEPKESILNEIYSNIDSHKRVIQSIEAQMLKLQVHMDSVNNDIKSLMYQKQIILGEEND